jgi:hypothetical protein
MAARPKNNGLYGNLLRLYPAPFRQQYGEPMSQTFADMLEDQTSQSGRFLVWARTLVNLPFSALGQHMNLKGGTEMTRKMVSLFGAGLLALIIVAIGSFWFGHIRAEQTVGIARVPVSRLGNAMQQDHFYSDYGNAAVLFNAPVTSLNKQKGLYTVGFRTQSSYSVTCQFATSPQAKVGQSLSLIAPGGRAVRQPHGVLLRGCEVL